MARQPFISELEAAAAKRERRIYWAALHAEEGCEASARELEDLLSEQAA